MGVTPVVSGVADFADELLGREEGVDLTRIGSATTTLTEEIREYGYDGTVTAGLLAAMYWQSFILSPAYERAFSSAGVLDATRGRVERMVVPHPVAGALLTPRFDLLVFAEGYDGEPVELEAAVSDQELMAGWSKASRELRDFDQSQPTVPSPAMVALRHYEALREVHKAGTFRLLLAKRPETTLTTVPSPAWAVRVQPGDPDFASAGVLARNPENVLGITVPNHLFCQEKPLMTPPGTPVSVRGVPGTVISCDLVTDSCFVGLPEVRRSVGVVGFEPEGLLIQERVLAPAGMVEGVASGAPPGHGSSLTFNGALSEGKTAVVSGYDPFIYAPSRFAARCLYTDAATGQGDSGAAALDERQRVVGFAFERSRYDAVPDWSSWIWAEAVMRAHDLTLLTERDFRGAPRTGEI